MKGIKMKDNLIKKIDEFLNPDLDKLHDPFLLPDMQKLVDRVIEAKKGIIVKFGKRG